MRRSLFVSTIFAVLILMFSAPQLRADNTATDTFNFTEQLSPCQTLSVVWQLPASPDTSYTYVDGIGFAQVNVPTSYFLNGSYAGTTHDAFLFLSNAAGGGFMDGLLFGLGGVNQVYIGPESNPTFVPGTYTGFDSLNFSPSGGLLSASLTISTPEPSSLLLLLTGFLALAAALALKRVPA
jgi:hypothetical protein